MSEKFQGVEHIFKGIPKAKLDTKKTPQSNLESLQADFARLGINIDPSCNIANSTLKKFIEIINAVLSPNKEFSPEVQILLRGSKLGESGERIGADLIESKEKFDFNIKIHARVTIGDGGRFGTSISIGEETNIGDNVNISTGTTIGKHCKVGSGVFFGHDCSVGDNTEIINSTTFTGKAQIPPNSRVVHKSADSTMAKIERKLKIV